MRVILRELIKIRNRAVWSWNGFRHVAKTEGSLWQWIIANIISASLTFFFLTHDFYSTSHDTSWWYSDHSS